MGFEMWQDWVNENKNYQLIPVFHGPNKTEYWIQEHYEVGEFIFYGKHNSIEKPIKYVHQLQNLYFALTGEELTFNF